MGGDENILEGQVALVTGASQGIGRAIALELAKHGVIVAANYSEKADGSDKEIDELVALFSDINARSMVYELDVSNIDGQDDMLKSVIDHFGRLDILVNNAGICEFTPFDKVTKEIYDRVMGVNFTAPYFLIQKAWPLMLKNDRNEYGLRGSIVNITSITAERGGVLQSIYGASKAALSYATYNLAETLGPDGIRINQIAPGSIATNINKKQREDDPEGTQKIIETVPLRRIGLPSDIAKAVVALCDDSINPYKTAAKENIDGGWRYVLSGQTSKTF